MDGLLHIVIVRALVEHLGLGVPRALVAASDLCDDADGRLLLPSGLELRVDLAQLRQAVEQRLTEAVETSVPSRRGRPPRRNARP